MLVAPESNGCSREGARRERFVAMLLPALECVGEADMSIARSHGWIGLLVLVATLVAGWAPTASAQLNEPPTADAGPDTSGLPGMTIILNGSNSVDPETLPMTFQWLQLSGTPAAPLSATDQALFSILVPNIGIGGSVMEFQLTVTDDHGETSSDSVSVSIIPEPGAAVLVMTGLLGLASRRGGTRERRRPSGPPLPN